MALGPSTHARAHLLPPAALRALLCAAFATLVGAGLLASAELPRPPVPDPYGLGERLALIDYLQQTFKATPAQGATLEELAALYWQLSERAQRAARSSDELLAEDRIARLRRELKDGFAIAPPASTGEDALVRLLAEARQKASDQALQEVLARSQAQDHARSASGASTQLEDDAAARARQGRFGAEARAKQEALDGVQGVLAAVAAELQALKLRIAGLAARDPAAAGQPAGGAAGELAQARSALPPLLERAGTLTRECDRLHGEIAALARNAAATPGVEPAAPQAPPVARDRTPAPPAYRIPPPAAGSMEERIKSAVVLLMVKGRGTGTGFFVTGSGLLVTNAHVVGDGLAEITAVWDGGAQHAPMVMQVVKIKPVEDLALLRASDGGTYQALEMQPHYELARPLLAAGFPIAGQIARSLQTSVSDIVITRGALAAVRKHGEVGEWLQHDCKIASGNSGGPLIDEQDGTVIGINTRLVNPEAVGGHGEAMSLAIPIVKVRQCFEYELGR